MIKFNGDLSTGDLTQWDSETDANGKGSYDSGDYLYESNVGAVAAAYLSKDIQLTRAVHFKFKFAPKNNDTFGTSKLMFPFALRKSGSSIVNMKMLSGAVDKGFYRFEFWYMRDDGVLVRADLGGGVFEIDLGAGNSPFTPGVESEFEVYIRMNTGGTNPDGVYRVVIDGTVLVNLTNVPFSVTQSDYIETIAFGVIGTDILSGGGEEYRFSDFQLSNNGVYDSATAQTYWLDGTNGTELGTGTEADPMRSAITAMSCPIIGNGDQVKLVNNGKLVPMRSNDTGPLEFPTDGTPNAMLTVNGNNAIYTGSTEHEFTGAGEHEITGIVQDPHRILVCTQADWDALGWDALDARVIGNGITTATASADNVGGAAVPTTGTVTSLATGEAGYSGTTVYYNSGGAAVHIEVPIRRLGTTVDNVIQLKQDYTEYKNMSVWLGRLKTILATGAGKGIGSVIHHSDIMEGWTTVINNANTATDFYMCEIAYCRKYAADSDCIVSGADSSGSVISCTVHHGMDDGISFSGALSSGDAIGNVVHTGGFANTGSASGIEFTGEATGTGIFNTVVGWEDNGILLNNTVAVRTEVRNNIVTNCLAGNGINGTAAIHLTADMDYNCCYNNGNNFWIGGAVSPTNRITSNPEFTSVATGGVLADRFTDDYHVSSASPVRDPDQDPSNDVCDKGWGTGPRPEGQDGAVPDRLTAMGAYQLVE